MSGTTIPLRNDFAGFIQQRRALFRQDAFHLRLFEYFNNIIIAGVLGIIARAVTTIMAQINGLVPLGSRGIHLVDKFVDVGVDARALRVFPQHFLRPGKHRNRQKKS